MKIYYKFNKMILFSDAKDIDTDFIQKNMRWRHIIVYALSFLIHIFAWYYVVVFCSVYTKSSVSWVCGGIISMVIKLFIIQPIIPLVLSLFRSFSFYFKAK